jgi:hypothetical protein
MFKPAAGDVLTLQDRIEVIPHCDQELACLAGRRSFLMLLMLRENARASWHARGARRRRRVSIDREIPGQP